MLSYKYLHMFLYELIIKKLIQKKYFLGVRNLSYAFSIYTIYTKN